MIIAFLRFSVLTCIVVPMALVGASALADNTVGSYVSPEYRRCSTAARSTVDKGNCLDLEYARQKAKLNRAYELLMRGQDGQQTVLIEKAQQSWLQFRELDCEAQAIKGGSAAYISHITCLIRLTADRAREMDGYGRW
jgi:uncharacterized protein YecT (DUF1311 family)